VPPRSVYVAFMAHRSLLRQYPCNAGLDQAKSERYHRAMTERARPHHVRRHHRWDLDGAGAVKIQERLRPKLSLRDGISFRSIRWIAGADVAYSSGDEKIFGAVVVLDFPDCEVSEEIVLQAKVDFPYIPGLLRFREAPVLLRAFSQLKQRPHVILFDAQGIAHPRGFGLASHAGLLLGIPSVGCAKTRLVGDYKPVARRRGSFSWLWFEGIKIGTVVRTRTDVKPVFVSPGDRISISTATRLVLAACHGYRLPEPIRRAHQLANRLRTQDSERSAISAQP